MKFLFFLFLSFFLLSSLPPSLPLFSHAATPTSSSKPSLKIGIVGSGISGSSAVYWFSNSSYFSSTYQLSYTVFEESSLIGGRIASVEMDHERIESGGSILHHTNHYMRFFTTHLNLTIQDTIPKVDSSV